MRFLRFEIGISLAGHERIGADQRRVEFVERRPVQTLGVGEPDADVVGGVVLQKEAGEPVERRTIGIPLSVVARFPVVVFGSQSAAQLDLVAHTSRQRDITGDVPLRGTVILHRIGAAGLDGAVFVLDAIIFHAGFDPPDLAYRLDVVGPDRKQTVGSGVVVGVDERCFRNGNALRNVIIRMGIFAVGAEVIAHHGELLPQRVDLPIVVE